VQLLVVRGVLIEDLLLAVAQGKSMSPITLKQSERDKIIY
jgi:hypothetical protein